MDRPFIKLMCESYYNDKMFKKKDLFKSKDFAVEEFNTEIISLMDNIYTQENELYYELKSENREFQRLVIYNLLDEHVRDKYGETVLQELVEYLAAGILLTIVTLIAGWKNVSRAQYHVVNLFGKLNESIYEFIKSKTAVGRVKYSMLISHLHVCARKCGIVDLSKLGSTVGMGIYPGQAISATSQKQAECIQECFLNYSITQIEILARAYKDCLKTTGEIPSDLTDLSILIKKPMGENCKEYYGFLEKFNDQFREVLDVLFHNDPRARQDWMNKYNTTMNSVIRDRRF